MTLPRRTFLGFTAVAALAAAGSALADRRRILAPPDATAPAAGGRLPELERAMRQLRIGSAVQHGGLAVFWLGEHGAGQHADDRDPRRRARVRRAHDHRARQRRPCPELVVDNRGKAHVLLLAGEILVGGKQNRVLREDILLPPLSGPRPIGVYCVEQGRWNEGRRDFESKSSFADPNLRRHVYDRVDQQSVWSAVKGLTGHVAAASPTTSYQQAFETPAVREHLGAAERVLDVKVAPDAVGAAVFVGATLSGVDVFGSPGALCPPVDEAAARPRRRCVRRGAADRGRRRRSSAARCRRCWPPPGRRREVSAATPAWGRVFEFGVERYRGAALAYERRHRPRRHPVSPSRAEPRYARPSTGGRHGRSRPGDARWSSS